MPITPLSARARRDAHLPPMRGDRRPRKVFFRTVKIFVLTPRAISADREREREEREREREREMERERERERS